MKKIFLVKNLIMFILPLLIPLLILGSFSFFITQKYVKDEININNTNLLNQAAQNIEMMMGELDALTISFNHDYSVVVRLRQILEQRTESLNLVALDMFNSMLKTPMNSKPYIHSIYLYYDNEHQNFISAKTGLTSLENFNDTSWYNSFMSNDLQEDTWIEVRYIKEYSFENPYRVITVYNKLYSSISRTKPTGVIVLNIRPDYIDDTLRGLITYPGQEILVVAENNEVIFSNTQRDSISKGDLEKIRNSDHSFFSRDCK